MSKKPIMELDLDQIQMDNELSSQKELNTSKAQSTLNSQRRMFVKAKEFEDYIKESPKEIPELSNKFSIQIIKTVFNEEEQEDQYEQNKRKYFE